jgi:peptidoglycan/xylan/chitin deacetylase (PgdA/CDA1 family)
VPLIPALLGLPGSLFFALGPERLIPRVTRRVVCTLPAGARRVALTFDDGPNPAATPRLLDVLAEHGVSATFFLLGRNLRRHPEVGRQIVARGHGVGNHTFSHGLLSALSDRAVREEIRSTHREIEDVLGVRPVLFRPPFGLFDRRVLDLIEAAGYVSVVGDVFPVDTWPGDPEVLAARVLGRVQPGSVVMLHDGYVTALDRDKSRTVEAVARIIPALRERGYEFVGLPGPGEEKSPP